MGIEPKFQKWMKQFEPVYEDPSKKPCVYIPDMEKLVRGYVALRKIKLTEDNRESFLHDIMTETGCSISPQRALEEFDKLLKKEKSTYEAKMLKIDELIHRVDDLTKWQETVVPKATKDTDGWTYVHQIGTYKESDEQFDLCAQIRWLRIQDSYAQDEVSQFKTADGYALCVYISKMYSSYMMEDWIQMSEYKEVDQDFQAIAQWLEQQELKIQGGYTEELKDLQWDIESKQMEVFADELQQELATKKQLKYILREACKNVSQYIQHYEKEI